MATITLGKGGEAIAQQLSNLSRAGEAIGKMATYEGAKVMADGIRASIDALPVDKFRYLRGGDAFSVITEQDKEDLLNSIGIDEIKRGEDGVRTVIGFAGYGRFKTKKYPNGLPMAMLMRAIESGSSVRPAQPTIRPTVSAKRRDAKAAMVKAGNEAIQNMTGKG